MRQRRHVQEGELAIGLVWEPIRSVPPSASTATPSFEYSSSVAPTPLVLSASSTAFCNFSAPATSVELMAVSMATRPSRLTQPSTSALS